MNKKVKIAAFLLAGILYGSDIAIAQELEVCSDACASHDGVHSWMSETSSSYICGCNDTTEVKVEKSRETEIFIIVPWVSPHRHYWHYPRYYPHRHYYRHERRW